jgi:hypothetical protein
MAERQQELVLGPNESAFILDRTSGQVLVYRGPHKEALSADNVPVEFRGGRFVRIDGESAIELAKQPFVQVNEDQYVILSAPAKEAGKSMSKGKNEAIPLQTGKTIVQRGPLEFPLWPGQAAEVIAAHQLHEDEYLQIRVTGTVSREDAERLWPLVHEDWKDARPAEAPAPSAGKEAATADFSADPQRDPSVPPAPPAPQVFRGPAPALPDDVTSRFPMGAEFVVRGSKMPLFIPPTGIIVVANLKGEYVRKGVRIEADEYVTMVNRSGRISFVYGPTTVVPCIDQEFKVNPADGKLVFEAVQIDDNSGVLLRTLGSMTVGEAKKRVPGINVLGAKVEDIDQLLPGTQLVVWKQNKLVFPADGIEIVDCFKAVHIKAGTARYVKNLLDGKTRVVPGERLYLADPRVEELVSRRLDDDQIKQWFSQGGYDSALVPCVIVPQGTAAMVLGTNPATGDVTRKVLIGHKIHFLQWDEVLATMRISGSRAGQPKTYQDSKRISFLWIEGNRINDVATGLRSRDDCEFSLEYTLAVDFDKAQSADWFNIDDYVYLVCDEVRSRLLGSLMSLPVSEIATNFVTVVRDAVLGKKEGDKPRVGLLFPRCGARLADINVKGFKLTDGELQQDLWELQAASVSESIATRRKNTELEGLRARQSIETAMLTIELATAQEKATSAVGHVKAEEAKNRAQADEELATQKQAIEHGKTRLAEQEALDKATTEADRAKRTFVAETERGLAEVEAARKGLLAKGEQSLLETDRARTQIEIDRLVAIERGKADAIAIINGSVVPHVAADLRSLAESNMASRVAESLGPAAGLQGMDVFQLLATMSGEAGFVRKALDKVRGAFEAAKPGSRDSRSERDR